MFHLDSGNDERGIVFEVANLLNGDMGLDISGIEMWRRENHDHILGSVDIKAANIDPLFFDRLMSITIETVNPVYKAPGELSISYIKQTHPVDQLVHDSNPDDSAIINIQEILDGDLTGKDPIQVTASASQNCGYCLQPRAVNTALMVCGGCRIARYCSKRCQKAHWSWH